MWNEFKNPGPAWRGKPFWSWNGELKKEELIRQVHVLKEMGFGGFFMHSRSGLATEYLGDEWFELTNAVADEAEKVGMEAWLYDEDRWPSGSAGGMVTVDPQYRMKSIWITESDNPAPEADCIARFAVTLEDGKLVSYRRLTDELQEGERAACFHIQDMPCNSNYNGTTYIDTMSRAAVDRFIELTHEQYAIRCGDRLGRSIKGIFTDEPHRGNMMSNKKVENGVMTCSAPWTGDLPQEFAARKGYDVMARLPELFYARKGVELSEVARDYFDVTNDLFIERFAMPINEWCEKHNIILTGHVLHEDSLTNQAVPNGSLMRYYEHMGYPGMDLLGPNNECFWAASQLNSACRQVGKTRLLSEMYGGSGWDFDLKGHKALGDWQALLGINLRCPHLSWYTMEGEAKRDYPASILHQSAWYPDYKQVEDYFARFGFLMAQGQPDCDVLVVNPIESVWGLARAGWARWIIAADEKVQKLEEIYARTYHAIANAGVDFDYGEEQMMEKIGSVSGAQITVGKMNYRIAVVSGALDLRANTKKLLADLLAGGGHVVFAGDVPENLAGLAAHANAIRCSVEELGSVVRGLSNQPASVSGKCKRPLFVKSRTLEDGSTLVAVLNLDRDNGAENMRLTVAGKYAWAERLDCETGRRLLQQGNFTADKAEIVLDMQPVECRIFRLSMEKPEAEEEPAKLDKIWEKEITGEFDYTLAEDNICVLDRCAWRWEDGQWHESKDVLRVDGEIRDEAGLEHRGGGMLQPWFAKKYDDPAFGNIELCYEFHADSLPEKMTLAAERPDRCQFFINGTPLTCPDENDFWIDVCFKKLPIPMEAVKPGKNIITMKTTFTRTSNMEAIYLLGAFGVQVEGVKETITTLPEKLTLGDLADQKLPFYTGPVTLHMPVAGEADKVCLQAAGFTGAAIRVDTGADEPQTMKWDPWQADVTNAAKNGGVAHVTLVPTRRDTFGPLHALPVHLPVCGPDHFVLKGDMWTDEYGLLENGVEKMTLVGYKG